MNSIHSILSVDDCEKIIRRDNRITSDQRVQILKYDANRLPGHPGYLGEYAFIKIQFRTGSSAIKSKRYFAKSLPYHDAVLTKAIEEWGIFRKEADLYSILYNRYARDSTKVTKWGPTCLLTQSNLIVMEDLTISGFRTVPFRTSFNELHMKLVFDRLAQMHACSLHFEIKHLAGKSIGSLYNNVMLFETTFTPNSGWFVAGLKGIHTIAVQRNRHAKDPSQRLVIEKHLWGHLERIYSLVKCTNQFRSVIVHRDLWANNIMFKFAEKDHFTKPMDCVLVDFQLARYLPPAIDFMCALYLLTNRLQRDTSTDSFIDHYYGALQGKLTILGLDIDTILSREEFDQSLTHYRLVGLIWAGVLHGFVNFPPGVMDQLHENDPETYTRISMENRDDFILKYYDCDSYYRERMDDVVSEILEYLYDFS
uniref:CHK kinase-like domain-containing protein n=1 Tax=Anopheles atroparvus TaxID=41427 RepID=A0AAG5DDD3_ANOAO